MIENIDVEKLRKKSESAVITVPEHAEIYNVLTILCDEVKGLRKEVAELKAFKRRHGHRGLVK